MGDLVDGEEGVLVGGAADCIGDEEELPREGVKGGVLGQVDREGKLKSKHAERNILGKRFVAHQSFHFGVSFQNGHSSRTMWFFRMHPEEVLGLSIDGDNVGQPSSAIYRVGTSLSVGAGEDGVTRLGSRHLGKRRIVELILL